MSDQEYHIEVSPGEPPVQNGYHIFYTEMNTAPTFQKDELQIVYQPKEPVKERIGGEELRIFIKVYAKEGRLPSDLTKAKIEQLVLNRVRDEFYPEEEPSEGGTTTTTTPSLATTNSTS
jgi:hypothetical protein